MNTIKFTKVCDGAGRTLLDATFRPGRQHDQTALQTDGIETLLLGLYCLREPKAIEQLNAASIRALGDAFAYFEDAGIVPAAVIRECAAKLGKPGASPKAWDMAKIVDAANGNSYAQDVHRRLYVPLSNFTVHASGDTLMRHVRRNDRLATAPSRAWNRRSPARVADAAAGILAAVIADNAALPYDELAAYAGRHEQRALMPVAFMGITGLSGTVKPGQLFRAISSYGSYMTTCGTAPPPRTRSRCALRTSPATSRPCSTPETSTCLPERSTPSSTTSPTS
jgi:hypothetical protein